MGRDKRGFTLVELLAVIVIIGIMAVFAFPYISNVITGNKNKVYVQDAKKLIALAEYKMDSNDIKIEKPDPGDCIILSYTYLNDGTLKDAPNKGEYLPGASYVVVKNVDGKMEYLVSLIETNDEANSFRGVLLVSENELNTSRAHEVVKSYKKDELLYVNEDASMKYMGDSSRVINKVLINDIRKNYIGGDVEKVYVYDDLEQGTSTDAYSPSIVTVNAETRFDMTQSKFVVDLSVVALDKDNDDENELKLCIRPSNTDDRLFYSSSDSRCVSYTSGSTYKNTYQYTTSAGGDICSVGKKMYYFISVSDPTKKYARKSIKIEMTKNTPPVINNVTVTKKSSEYKQIHVVTVNVDAEDDFSKPMVCINESENDNNCTYMDYKKSYEYTLKDDSGHVLSKPDGNLHKIYVHFKDSCGLVTTSQEQQYQVDALVDPSVSFGFSPHMITRTISSLSGDLNIEVNDPFVNGVNSEISLIVESNGTELFRKRYDEYLAGDKTITLNGDYDGIDRELKLKVQSKYGRNVERTYKQSVYKNQAPNVGISIYSKSIPNCIDCVGSYDVSYSLDVSDDLDSNSALKYCISENATYCNNNSHYNSFNSEGHYTFSGSDDSKPYNGAKKKLYVSVMDSQGEKKQVSSDYTIYKNQAPEVTGSFEVIPFSSDGKENKISIIDDGINIVDDFNNYKVNLCYTVNSNSDVLCLNDEYVDYDKLIDISNSSGFILKDSDGNELNGATARLFLSIKDNFDEITTSSPTIDYEVKQSHPPTISSLTVSSVDDYNSKSVAVKFTVNDEDENDSYQICIKDRDDCIDTDYSGTRYNFGQEYEVDYDIPWNEGTKNVFLRVKDKYDLTDSKSVEYSLYTSCSEIDEIVEEEREGDGDEISGEICGGRCYVTQATDPETQSNIFDISVKYTKKISYVDKYLRTECREDSIEEVTHNCDYYTCFGNVDDTIYNAIGTKLRGNEEWTFNFLTNELDESGVDFSFDTIADGGVTSEVTDDEQPTSTDPIVRSIQCNGHYNRYKIKINSGGAMTASLIEGEEICPELADSGYSFYRYNSSDSDPYIRFDDSGFSG